VSRHPELLRQFTQVDYANHVALVAEVFADGRETVISEARYVRAADPSSAEVSVSVAEPWQGKGLAKVLLTKLECRVAAAGVRRIFGETLASNERMLSLARKAGFVISERLSARGVMRLEKTLAVLDHVANSVPGYVGRQPQPRVTE
jgi:RimJ/RimL family protein N-acetyltransferase